MTSKEALDKLNYECIQVVRKMTTKEKIALINRMIDHLFNLSCQGKLSDDELLYLHHVFWCIRQYYRIMNVKE